MYASNKQQTSYYLPWIFQKLFYLDHNTYKKEGFESQFLGTQFFLFCQSIYSSYIEQNYFKTIEIHNKIRHIYQNNGGNYNEDIKE